MPCGWAIVRARQRSRAPHVDIEAVVGCGDLDVERLSDRYQRLGDGPCRIERAAQAGVENRAAVDGNDVVRTCRRKSDLEHVMGAHTRVQGNPPATAAMGIDQGVYLAGEPRLRQRLDHDIAFPGAITLRLPVLNRATAADCKMRTKWRDPLRAGALDREQPPAVGMAGYGSNLDRLAAERVRHVYGLSVHKADAVAVMRNVIDDETFSHGARR